MMQVSINLDDSGLRNLMAQWMVKKRKTVEQGLITASNTLCKAFMQFSVPKTNVKVESMVRGQVHSVYRSKAQAWEEIQKNNPGLGKAFWEALNGKKQLKRAEGILRKYGGSYASLPFLPFDGGAAHRAARGARGAVPKGQRPAMVVHDSGKNSTLTKYAKMRMNNVGMVKAGWVAAWRDIDRVRDVPAWVRRTKGETLGSAVKNFNNTTNQSIIIHNAVRHADEAIEQGYQTRIEAEASERLAKYFKIQLGLLQPK